MKSSAPLLLFIMALQGNQFNLQIPPEMVAAAYKKALYASSFMGAGAVLCGVVLTLTLLFKGVLRYLFAMIFVLFVVMVTALYLIFLSPVPMKLLYLPYALAAPTGGLLSYLAVFRLKKNPLKFSLGVILSIILTAATFVGFVALIAKLNG